MARGSHPHHRGEVGTGRVLLYHLNMKNTNLSHPAQLHNPALKYSVEILYSLQFPGLFPRHISTRRKERLQSLSLNKSGLFPEEILS